MPLAERLKLAWAGSAWPVKLCGALLIVLLVAVSVIYSAKNPHSITGNRAFPIFSLTALLLSLAYLGFAKPGLDGKIEVRFVVAMNTVFFIVVGGAAAMLICSTWEAPLLLGGLCLLVGGFAGLLFGYPQGVAAQSKSSAPGIEPAGRDKTLLAESAATFGKIITGFTLASLGSVKSFFWKLCHYTAPTLFSGDNRDTWVLAGIIIGYFLAVGFFAGLLLPNYFMRPVLGKTD